MHIIIFDHSRLRPFSFACSFIHFYSLIQTYPRLTHSLAASCTHMSAPSSPKPSSKPTSMVCMARCLNRAIGKFIGLCIGLLLFVAVDNLFFSVVELTCCCICLYLSSIVLTYILIIGCASHHYQRGHCVKHQEQRQDISGMQTYTNPN